MKIVALSHYFDTHRGGVEIVAGKLAGELARRGFAVTWLASDASPPPVHCQGVRAVPLRAGNSAERTIGIPYPLPCPSALRRIASEVAVADVVLIHDALYLTSIAGFAAACRHGKPVLIVQHIGEVPYKNPLFRSAMRIANRVIAAPLLARVDQTVFIGETTARHFAHVRFRAPPELIFNGVDIETFSPAADRHEIAEMRRRLGLPVQGQVALFVGRFVEKKGLPVLRRLAAARPDLTFAFAGWGPDDPRRWEMPNVRVFDGLGGPTLAVLYRAADVLVLPSTGEGFPLVLQEALASGLAVVCGEEAARADPKAARYLTGVPVDLGNSARTAKAFELALQQALDAKNTAPLRAERYALARERYSWSAASARYAALLRRLARATPRTAPIIVA